MSLQAPDSMTSFSVEKLGRNTSVCIPPDLSIRSVSLHERWNTLSFGCCTNIQLSVWYEKHLNQPWNPSCMFHLSRWNNVAEQLEYHSYLSSICSYRILESCNFVVRISPLTLLGPKSTHTLKSKFLLSQTLGTSIRTSISLYLIFENRYQLWHDVFHFSESFYLFSSLNRSFHFCILSSMDFS